MLFDCFVLFVSKNHSITVFFLETFSHGVRDRPATGAYIDTIML